MTFSKQVPATIETTNTKIPNVPDFSFTNPLKKNMFVNGVEIVSTPEFSRKGVIIIAVDNVILFDSRDTEGFSNVAFMPINLNAVFERDRIVTVSAFNQVDTNKIKVTINVFIDEVERTLNSSLEYFSQDVVNKIISKTDILFPFQVYTSDESPITKLIDMEGYKKLVVLLSASSIATIEKIQEPTIDTYTIGTRSWPNQFNELVSDDLLTTFSFTDSTEIEIWDTKNSNAKNLSITITPHTQEIFLDVTNGTQGKNSNDCSLERIRIFGNSTSLWDIDESSQADFAFDVVNLLTDVTTSELSNLATTKRYIRFTQKVTVSFSTLSENAGNTNNCTVNNCTNNDGCLVFGGTGMPNVLREFHPEIITSMFDSLTTNGSASLSFEVLDIASNKFLELIASSEFGTVTEGQEVISQVGDVTTISASGFTYALPSTQTDFRAKLSIVGGIETGITIVKVE